MTNEDWPDQEKTTSRRIIKGGWRLKKRKNKSIKAEQFGNHEGVGRGVTSRADNEETTLEAQKIRAKIHSLPTLQERVNYILGLIEEVKKGNLKREAISGGTKGFVQELTLAQERIETEAARERQKRRNQQ